ncbi:MAG: PHP domain-containing protein, partial [Spirochaetota bacterium]
DGSHSLLELAHQAKEMGYEYLGITDHSQSLRIAGGMSEEKLKTQIREIRKLNESFKDLQLLAGIEVDIKKDGSLDYGDNLLKQLDIVIAAVHSGFKMESGAMTERIVKAMQNQYVNIIAHPTGRVIGEREPYQVDMKRLVKEASDTGTFLELNAYPDRLDLKDIHARMAKEKGVLIAVGTDAHNTMQLNLMFFGVATARRGWLEKKDVLNTRSLKKLQDKLNQKRR